MIILIADDDRLIRFTIKSMLKDILGDSGDVFLEAANGKDMVKICSEQKPDIAFVDIKMPYMNGLDSIGESRRFSPNTEYVIISGYSDFEYAKRGISLMVNEYLLKPVDEEQLAAVMSKLKEKRKKQKQESNSEFQLRVMSALNFYSVTDGVGPQNPGNELYLTFILYVRTNAADRTGSAKKQEQLLYAIRDLGERVVAKEGHYALAATDECFPCAVFGVEKEMQNYIIHHMRQIMEIKEADRESFHYAVWFEADSLDQVCRTCSSLDAQTYMGIQYLPGGIYEYNADDVDAYSREFLYDIDQIMTAWENADGVACKEVMNKIWRQYKDKKPDVDLNNVSRYCSFITGCRIEGDCLKSFCRSIVEQSDQMYQNLAGEERDMIAEIKEYIQKYYGSGISISQIADHFGVTANYLSALFHQKTGEKFIDYLTKVRINAAKKLLLQNLSASVQDIALMVGYNSTRHFSSLFQKRTGMTPSMYRKKRL